MKIKITTETYGALESGDIVDAIINPCAKDVATVFDSEGVIWYLRTYEIVEDSLKVESTAKAKTPTKVQAIFGNDLKSLTVEWK